MKNPATRPSLRAWATAILAATAVVTARSVEMPLPESTMPGLEALVRSALSKSPRTMARDFDLLNAQYSEMISSSRQYPQVGGNFQFQVREEDQGETAGRHVIERSYYNLTINQAIWHWGTVRASTKVGELGTLIAEHNLEAARREIALEVRSTYLGLILQKIGVRNARFNERLARENLARQEERLRVNEVTAGVVADARLRLDEASLGAERGASDLEFAIRAFRRLTGVEGFAEADIPERITPPPAEPLPAQQGQGYLKSEALLTRDLQIEQGKLNELINRKALWPKINAIAGVSQDDNLYSSTLDRKITNVAAFVGVQVQWTIFDGFASKGRRLISQSNLRESEQARDDLLVALKDSADQQASNVGFSWSAYQNSKRRNDGARNRLAYEKDNLTRGLSSEEQVAQIQAGLNQAELVADDALAKFYNATARYVSTMRSDPLIDRSNN